EPPRLAKVSTAAAWLIRQPTLSGSKKGAQLPILVYLVPLVNLVVQKKGAKLPILVPLVNLVVQKKSEARTIKLFKNRSEAPKPQWQKNE
ncbi:hypothetical protein QWY85_01870, partial [Neolewinella lacunae]|uniref:hypothetical protein n=1 Tax=Neolewinella lacunae TaxID=1517758 RepID=UPI0025B414CC